MSKCLIFGNNYFAELMCEYLNNYTDTEVEAFLVNKKYITEQKISGKNVVAYEDIQEIYDTKEYKILVTSGYRGMNGLRSRICKEVKEKGYQLQSFIHPDANVYADKIGEGNIILEGAIIGKHVCIGEGNIIWNGVNISHHTVINDYNFLAPSCTIGGKATIKNNCFFGLNSTVKGGIIAENYTLVGAAAYLERNSEEYDVYVHGVRGKLAEKNSLEIFK